MGIKVKYIGTTQRWPEIAVTGGQSIWWPGQMEERAAAEATALLATGLFEHVDPPVPVLSALVTVTAAQIADLHNTPVELVAAPGAGRAIAPVQVTTAVAGNATDAAGGTVQYDDGDAWSSDDVLAAAATTVPLVTTAVELAEDTALHLVSDDPILLPGAIVASALAAGGTGWAKDDTFKVGNAEFVVTAIAAETGAVSTYDMTAAGTSNVLDTGVAATDASGDGINLSIDITELDYSVNLMTLQVKTLYTVTEV